MKIPVKLGPYAFPKLLRDSPQKLEARVGIEQRLHLSQTSPKPFGSGDFSNCCTGNNITSAERLNQANNFQHRPTISSNAKQFWCPFWCPFPLPVNLRRFKYLSIFFTG